MSEDRPHQNISLNLIALCVFGLTASSLLAPLFQVSGTVPLLLIGGIVAIATFDNFFLKSLLSTLVIDALSSNDGTYRQRIINHEAGHFLVAYLSGITIESYSLTAWEALKQGQSAQGGTVFAPLSDSNIPAELLQKYCRVWMAGIAAERLVYERAEGGFDDRQKLRRVMALIGKDAQAAQQQENLAIIQAKDLIQTNWEVYQALTAAMTARKPVAECCQVLQSSLSQPTLNPDG